MFKRVGKMLATSSLRRRARIAPTSPARVVGLCNLGDAILEGDKPPPGKPSAGEGQAFRFMDLPSEIRNMVYDFLWTETPRISLPYVPKQPKLWPYYFPLGYPPEAICFFKQEYYQEHRYDYESEGEEEVLLQHKREMMFRNQVKKQESTNSNPIPHSKVPLYHAILVPVRLEAIYDGDHVSLEGKTLTGLPVWLLTSKALLREGLHEFRLRADLYTGRGFTHNQPGMKWGARSRLLRPHRINKLTFKGRFLQVHVLGNRSHTQTTIVFGLNPFADQQLATILQGFNRLEYLHVQCSLPRSRAPYQQGPYRVDLSRLLEGGLWLRYLFVSVHGLVAGLTPLNCDAVLVAFMEEIARVGKTVVRGEGDGEVGIWTERLGGDLVWRFRYVTSE